ncbi:MAG: 3-ketoacyl-ACP reductase [Terriglobia bacterium]|jgi:NAD(P)-dependent dehydrogenase (short-subunit alcohol dehydrogenase family)
MISEKPVALVTGASRGIGRGIAIALARSGYSVAINYYAEADRAFVTSKQDPAAECVRLCQEAAPAGSGASFETFPADISEARYREQMLEAVAARFGWIDLLVNNAGIAPAQRKDLLEATEESFNRLISVNLRGPFFLTQAVANFWLAGLAEHAARPRPKVITISSISAYTASIDRGDYCISKAGLSMMTQLFAVRLAGEGIGVYEIRPGIMATDMTGPVKGKYDRLIAEGLTPIARWGTPEDVGRAVVAIAQDQFPFSTGEVFNVDGGFHIRRL